MILDQEIRSIARELGVEHRIVDLDYTLGWALWGMWRHAYLRERLVSRHPATPSTSAGDSTEAARDRPRPGSDLQFG